MGIFEFIIRSLETSWREQSGRGIHHMASSLQAVTIVGNAAAETEVAIARLFPDELGDQASAAEAQHLLRQAAQLTW